MKRQNPKLTRNKRGFVLVVVALSSVVFAACLGLGVDMGRIYISKNETQAYADAASLAAALKLDGTSDGVTAAQTAATSVGNKWNFASVAFTSTLVEVATSSAGPWTSASSPPSPATDYTYVRVTANAPVTLYFSPAVTALLSGGNGLANSTTVKAAAVSAQLPQTTFNTGAFPFSPIAFDGPTGGSKTTAPFGFIVGQQYTMRYPSSSGKSGECAGDDADSNHIKIGSDRGFWGSNSASTASGEIEGLTQEESLTIGQVLPGVGGAKTSVQSALVYRIDQDGDTTDDTYAAYLANSNHNGQRVAIMPLQSEVDGTVLAFGTFLLLDDAAYGHTGNSPWCAVYIGEPIVANSPNPGAGSAVGPYQVKLIQ